MKSSRFLGYAVGGRFSAEAKQIRMEKKKHRRSLEHLEFIPSFEEVLLRNKVHPDNFKRKEVSTLQVNIGLTCNMSCTHCHVESTPTRTETLKKTTAQRIITLLEESSSIKTVDITGGAPEMHEQFQYLVKSARDLGKDVIDRCNLTIAVQPGYEWIPSFLAEHGVAIAASMPCYSPENVDKQRGDKTFDQSIKALQVFNSLGYGKEGSGLELNLVYNPLGAFLPPSQKNLEIKYKEELRKAFGIEFNQLFTITNMPIKRFADDLRKSERLKEYMDLLIESFNPGTLNDIMCRSTIHVDYNGMISDCDFNSALEIPTGASEPSHGLSIFEIESFEYLNNQPIKHGKHCFGCTAGSGSS